MIACRLLSRPGALLTASGARAADLRIGMSADVTSIDPHFVNITPNNNVAWHIFEALTHVDENVRLVPGLAESWRPVDPTTWEFKLRKGVRFSDGSDSPPRTSRTRSTVRRRSRGARAVHDVHPADRREGDRRPPYDPPEDRDAVRDGAVRHELRVHRVEEGGGRREHRGLQHRQSGDRHRAVQARALRPRRPVELVRNDAYAGRSRRGTGSLPIMPSDGARVSALLADDLDAIEYVPTADLGVRSTPRFRIQKVSWRTIFFTARPAPRGARRRDRQGGRPLDRNPFADARVREAMAKAINRQAIVDRVMEGAAVPASNLVAAGLRPRREPEAGALRRRGRGSCSRRPAFRNGFATRPRGAEQPLPERRPDRADRRAAARAHRHRAKVQTMPLAAVLPEGAQSRVPGRDARLGLVLRRSWRCARSPSPTTPTAAWAPGTGAAIRTRRSTSSSHPGARDRGRAAGADGIGGWAMRIAMA